MIEENCSSYPFAQVVDFGLMNCLPCLMKRPCGWTLPVMLGLNEDVRYINKHNKPYIVEIPDRGSISDM